MLRAAPVLMLLASPSAVPVVRGLDHAPVAVIDLDRAAADFRRLGFVLKPGRAHADGIRNMHAKFPNHGGIEFISVSRPHGPLADEYARWLAHGEGGAWWAAYAPDTAALAARLSTLGLARQDGSELPQTALPHRVFFGTRGPSPTDAPRWYAHPNTAYRLTAVWLAGSMPERRLLASLGVPEHAEPVCAPFARTARALVFAEGDRARYVDVAAVPDRAILALTVRVRDLAVATRFVAQARVPSHRCPRSIWARSHGVWLEFEAT